MDRRELLKMVAALTGGAVIGGELFLTGCKTGAKLDAGFSQNTIAFLNEIGETILPATSSPGAKETNVGEFMKAIVSDCYTADEQKIFMAGITKLDESFEKAHKKSFMDATPEQRNEFITALDKEAKDYQGKKKGEDPTHYFIMMKQLTITGFFTSKLGATKALRHLPVPGRYDGAYPYKKGDKAWAE